MTTGIRHSEMTIGEVRAADRSSNTVSVVGNCLFTIIFAPLLAVVWLQTRIASAYNLGLSGPGAFDPYGPLHDPPSTSEIIDSLSARATQSARLSTETGAPQAQMMPVVSDDAQAVLDYLDANPLK